MNKLVADGVPVVTARRLPGLLRDLPATLGPERIATLIHHGTVHDVNPEGRDLAGAGMDRPGVAWEGRVDP